ncbi:nep1, putative [Perkinsus marinus ATCC 50983]|uniref:Nep1, putative n=1 Tax=Perkinsus marinus (strain ATCC 50983 / TXsc) TaxID=423536 RepID=C5KF47_PERM5|nr:nep1, putative [Perkinsus marinus ATCC 50983]EER16849.1 nep1, putative [Perkinsus marinus ATCC 50983]|eukprot:XP_002785053.1 nep1, putative [Perkinsus marinus ATCC 50983]
MSALKRTRTEERSSSRSDALVGHTVDEAKALIPRTPEEKTTGQRLVVVLEKAALEVVQVKGKYELLNSDDHKNILAKSGKDISSYRPDITHQCLMMLLDSPLNKAGKLLIYVHTMNNVLIEVSPALRMPRTFKRFSGLIVELLNKNKIRAANSSEILMKVIANPVQKYLPAGGIKCGLSVDGRLLTCNSTISYNIPVTVVIGAVAHGEPCSEPRFGGDYVEETIAISNHGLSAAICCAKLTCALEDRWGII